MTHVPLAVLLDTGILQRTCACVDMRACTTSKRINLYISLLVLHLVNFYLGAAHTVDANRRLAEHAKAVLRHRVYSSPSHRQKFVV